MSLSCQKRGHVPYMNPRQGTMECKWCGEFLPNDNDSERKAFYALGMHESWSLDQLPGIILRVPGGWIYTLENRDGNATATFVPFDNEFQT